MLSWQPVPMNNRQKIKNKKKKEKRKTPRRFVSLQK